MRSAAVMKKYPTYNMLVVGYTDNRGRRDELLARSQAQATAVYSALVGARRRGQAHGRQRQRRRRAGERQPHDRRTRAQQPRRSHLPLPVRCAARLPRSPCSSSWRSAWRCGGASVRRSVGRRRRRTPGPAARARAAGRGKARPAPPLRLPAATGARRCRGDGRRVRRARLVERRTARRSRARR